MEVTPGILALLGKMKRPSREEVVLSALFKYRDEKRTLRQLGEIFLGRDPDELLLRLERLEARGFVEQRGRFWQMTKRGNQYLCRDKYSGCQMRQRFMEEP